MGKVNPTGYSATVRMWLLHGDRVVPLSHTSSTFVIAWEPVDLPAGDAQIVFTVDGTRYEREVTLVKGMTAVNREAMVISRDKVAPF